jgi:hypothetical protein
MLALVLAALYFEEQLAPVHRQQVQIRLVLDLVLGDEYADRQYALERIDAILRSAP